jgi:hypothetical protein
MVLAQSSSYADSPWLDDALAAGSAELLSAARAHWGFDRVNWTTSFENHTLGSAAKNQLAHSGTAADPDDNELDVVLEGDINDQVARVVVALHVPDCGRNPKIGGALQGFRQFCLCGGSIFRQGRTEDPQICAAQGRLVNGTLQGNASFIRGDEANGNTHVYSCLLVYLGD